MAIESKQFGFYETQTAHLAGNFVYTTLTMALAQAGASTSTSASALAAAVVSATDVEHACHLAICQLAADSHSLTGKEAPGEEWNRSCAAFRAAMKRRGWILGTDKKLYTKVVAGNFPDPTILTRTFDTSSLDAAAKAATDDAMRAGTQQQAAECAVLTGGPLAPMFPSTEERITDRVNEAGEGGLLDTDIVTVQMTRKEARDVAVWLAARRAIANLPDHMETGEVEGHLVDLGLRAVKLQAALDTNTSPPKPVSLTRVKGRPAARLSGAI